MDLPSGCHERQGKRWKHRTSSFQPTQGSDHPGLTNGSTYAFTVKATMGRDSPLSTDAEVNPTADVPSAPRVSLPQPNPTEALR